MCTFVPKSVLWIHPHHADPDPDLDPSFTLCGNGTDFSLWIRILIKVMPISNQWSRQTLYILLHSEPPRLHCGRPGPPWLYFERQQLLNFDFDVTRIQIRILLFTLMRIRIWLQLSKMMRIRIRNTGLSCKSTHAYLHLFQYCMYCSVLIDQCLHLINICTSGPSIQHPEHLPAPAHACVGLSHLQYQQSLSLSVPVPVYLY
jgi:hypothetical protein